MKEQMSILPAKLPELALSYGLESLIAETAQADKIGIQDLAAAALRLYPEKVVQQHLEDLSKRFIQRVERLVNARQAEGEKPSAASEPKRTFGSNLEEWTDTLDPTGICLYLADYDPHQAHRLYWWAEADLLELTLKSKLRFESVKHSNMFEAMMYGFGGKYESDPGSGDQAAAVETHDLTTDEGRQALQGMMGFNF